MNVTLYILFNFLVNLVMLATVHFMIQIVWNL